MIRKEMDTSKLIRYSSGKYKGKIDWQNNIGAKLPFIYGDISGEIEIVNYVKAIPQGTITVGYNNKTKSMHTGQLTKCRISDLIGLYNYTYLYNVGDIIDTKISFHKVKVKKQIKLWHTKCYERAYLVECLECNHEYEVREYVIATCPLCSDRISYGERFVISIFRQLDIEITPQKMFDWSDWKRYDLFLPKTNTIIEVHGAGHYEPTMLSINPKLNIETPEENLIATQENDKIKEEIAIENNITNYIVINAHYSTKENLQQSILSSKTLNRLYDLSKIDWDQCDRYATSSNVKLVSEAWGNGKTLDEIAKDFNLMESTVKSYLYKGDNLGYCDFKVYKK